jgi:hypothetical protein
MLRAWRGKDFTSNKMFLAFAPLSVNLFRLNDIQFCPFAPDQNSAVFFLRATDDAMRSSRVFRRFIHFTFRGDPSEKKPVPNRPLEPENLC